MRLKHLNHEKFHTEKTINKKKVISILAIIFIIVVLVIFLIYINSSKSTINEENEQILETVISDEENTESTYKTCSDLATEFGGTLTEQVKEDTWYMEKDGITYTVYENDGIVGGKIIPWQGGSIEPQKDEDGTYKITTGEELKWIADQVISGQNNFAGITVRLEQDIDLGARVSSDGTTWNGIDWTPMIGYNYTGEQINETAQDASSDINTIDEKINLFAGIFEGNNHKIRGIYISSGDKYQGLFGASYGTIQNLTICNSNVVANTSSGILVGLNDGVINNCTIINSSIKGNEKIGGLAGINMVCANITNSTVQNDVKVAGGDYTGGIVGYMNNNSTISQVKSLANISGNNYVGGITGISFFGSQITSAECNVSYIIGSDYVGGLVGYSQSQIDSSKVSVGNVDGYIQGNNYVGGIVGINYEMGNIQNSGNLAKVIAKNDNLGGIAGVNNAGIIGCYNKGIIDASNSEGERIGGICGQNSSNCLISSCFNTGNVEFTNSADGICSANYGTVSDCFALDSSCTSIKDEYKISEDNFNSEIISNLYDYFKVSDNEKYPILAWEE